MGQGIGFALATFMRLQRANAKIALVKVLSLLKGV